MIAALHIFYLFFNINISYVPKFQTLALSKYLFMAEQLPDLLLDITSSSITNQKNILVPPLTQTLQSDEPKFSQFNRQEITVLSSKLSDSHQKDTTIDLLIPNSNQFQTSPFQDINKNPSTTDKCSSNSTAYSSPLIKKTGLNLNFQKLKIDKGQYANSSNQEQPDNHPSIIRDASRVTKETLRVSSLRVNSTDRMKNARPVKPIEKLNFIPRLTPEIKKYPVPPTGLRIKQKYLPELSSKDPNVINETLLASRPITMKYEEIIEKFTGKLKMNNDANSEVAISEDDIKLCGEIGEGVSGTVYIVEHKASGLQMAAKKMKWKPHLEEQKRILMDLEIMAIQNSKYIVEYYGSLVAKDNVWLYMELMDTCLDKIIHNYGPLPEAILGKVVVATLNALHYLKSVHDVIHRDVKPSNILLNKRGEIKMCDFGISKQLVESCAQTRGAGPTAYISPERLDIELKEYDVRADVWSLGITVIELLTGKLPYSHCLSDIEVMSKIFQDPPPRLPEPIAVSQDCRDFIELCLTKDYQKRPKFQELLQCSQFVRVYETKEVQVSTWFSSLSTHT